MPAAKNFCSGRITATGSKNAISEPANIWFQFVVYCVLKLLSAICTVYISLERVTNTGHRKDSHWVMNSTSPALMHTAFELGSTME